MKGCSGTVPQDEPEGRMERVWEGVQDGEHVHTWLIHVNDGKTTAVFKVISLQLNK